MSFKVTFYINEKLIYSFSRFYNIHVKINQDIVLTQQQ